ncbi:hypothetical protein [Nocardioides litoris]|uniref:hypothetical protein n=1 Tax=Nocardioides litoris TaxID=1926648 RepID=UPI0011206B1B|nr:hypothetical protein [Nocardioides litoris]
MSDLFAASAFTVTRSVRGPGRLDYEVVGPGGPVAVARQRDGSGLAALRKVFSRSHPGRVFDLTTVDGSPRLVVSIAPGTGLGYETTVHDASGALVGTASARAGMLGVKDARLVDAAGGDVGSLGGRLPRQLTSPDRVARGVVGIAVPDDLAARHRTTAYTVELAPEVPPHVRDLVVAATISADAATLSAGPI